MADHLWFVPVAGGGRTLDLRSSLDFNVQYDYNIRDQQYELPELLINIITAFNPPSQLLTACSGDWRWRSCASSGNVINQAQLSVGTVFGRRLPITGGDPVTWGTVDIWVKFMVNDPDRFDDIRFFISDSSGNSDPSGNLTSLLSANTWFVAHKRRTTWSGWDSENLRATLRLQGTTTAANVGLTRIFVEWFAFRLSDET